MTHFLKPPNSSAAARLLSVAFAVLTMGTTTAAPPPPPPPLAEFPLAWSDQVIPNFLITLDDSRSMAWGYLPEAIFPDVYYEYNNAGDVVLDGSGNPKLYYPRSVHWFGYNKLAYDPGTTYRPPRKPDGTRFPDAVFTAANIDGFEPYMTGGLKRVNGHHSSVVNLSSAYRMTWDYPFVVNTTTGVPTATPQLTPFANDPQAAFYTTKKTTATCTTPVIASPPYLAPASEFATPALYAAAKAAHGPAWITWKNRDINCFTVSTSTTWTAAQKTNFANWYSFSRTRILGALSGLVTAMSSTSADIRVACQTLQNTVGAACNTSIPPMQVMDVTGRSALVQSLMNTPIPGDTKLREAAYRAMTYFKNTNASNPWAFNPSAGVIAPEYSCRQSFHMMVTDGAWTVPRTGDPDLLLPLSDQDSTLANTTNNRPYRDPTNPASEVTLADIAYQAWNTDLRPDLANNVPMRITVPAPPNPTAAQIATRNANPDNDPAGHQHLSTFTVGFGVNGTLNFPSDLAALKSGGKQWTGVFKTNSVGVRVTNAPGRVDDLWHAAINGRGRYFSAGNPSALAASIQSIIDTATKGTASGASAASSSNVGSNSTAVYISSYTGGSWSGDLKNYPIVGGVVQTTATWSAAAKVDAVAYTARNIYTREGGTRYNLTYGNMTPAMQAVFNSPIGSMVADGLGTDRVNFIRGQRTKEQLNGGEFRNRISALGDIVNSGTAFVGAPVAGYDEPRFPGYTNFADSNATRTKMLYFGANDGMLHGVNAATGNEAFAFIPGALLRKTRALPEMAYSHKTYVDATPYATDVNVGGWKTLLFAPFGTGAKGLFALDVTAPSSVSATSNLWELTSLATPDLGYIMGTPQRHPVTGAPRNVGRFGSAGRWAVFLPNGYNSDFEDENLVKGTGSASLIVVDLGTATDANISTWTLGGNLRVIPTPVAGDGPYNGLSMPTGVDINGDGKTDVLYAGDLKGNLWKFEMTDPTTGFTSHATPQVKRLFKAVSAAGDDQAITVAPSVLRRPDGKYTVIFGTGRLLNINDKTKPPSGFPKQSLYGIVDDGVAAEITRTDLFAHRIVATYPTSGSTAGSRFIEPVPAQTGVKRGWRLDLDSTLAQDDGERVISNSAILPGGAVVFSTSAPSTDACTKEGTGWTMIVDGLTGGRLGGATFDLDRDGNSENDARTISGKSMFASGMQSEVGVSPTPLILSTGSSIQLVTGGASRGWSSAQIAIKNTKFSADGRPLYGRISWQEIGR